VSTEHCTRALLVSRQKCTDRHENGRFELQTSWLPGSMEVLKRKMSASGYLDYRHWSESDNVIDVAFIERDRCDDGTRGGGRLSMRNVKSHR
jgi:hypothetical protein